MSMNRLVRGVAAILRDRPVGVRGHQRAQRSGPDHRAADRRPAAAGRGRGHAVAPELRADPGAVRWRRAGPGVRIPRGHGRPGHRGRPGDRRADPGHLRRPGRLALVSYVNLPIGLVALALAARLLPATAGTGRRGVHLDLVVSLLLGGGVLSLLLPLVDATDGGLTRLWPLIGLAVGLLAGFVWWEARTVRRGHQPLLDPQLARTDGYASGLAIGLVYFVGYTGIWLVLALFFQDGLGYSPLRSGLAVTPFALGVAASAVLAGRLVGRVGRWLTVTGLTMTAVGLAATALVLRQVGGDQAAWAAAGPLLLGGLGGGMVTSPNVTMTLASVPVKMAGAAGGALQTAQRIGSAIGTALLASVFYRVLTGSGHDYPAAVSDALLCASGLMLLALLLATAELWHRRTHRREQPTPTPQPQPQQLHLT